MSNGRARPSRITFAFAVAIILLLAAAVTPASAANVFIQFDDGTVINDGAIGDLDGNIDDRVIFAGNYGFAQYFIKGELYLSPTWPTGQTLGGFSPPIVGALTLTNFTATAVPGSLIGQTSGIRIRGDVIGPVGGTAVDSIDAEVGNASFTPVPAGTDFLQVWQTAIFDLNNFVGISPPTGAPLPQPNPFHPGPGTTPYLTSGNGPIATPGFVNPTIDGLLVFSLGQTDDQFILPNSAEIGVTPEPGAAATLLCGMSIFAFARRRAPRHARCC